jgi:hypothetical protein
MQKQTDVESALETLGILAAHYDFMASDKNLPFSAMERQQLKDTSISLRQEQLAVLTRERVSLAVASALVDADEPVYLPEPMPDELRAEIDEEKTTQAQQDAYARNAGVVDGLLIVLSLFALALIF